LAQNNSVHVSEELEASLRENFKLSSYETKTYLSLLKLGRQTPKQISTNAKVPMPRVYDTLESLMAKGFVIKQEEFYSAMPPKSAIHGRSLQFEDNFSREQRARKAAEAHIVKALEQLDLNRSKASSEGEISILKGFNAIANKFTELLETSQELILVAKRAIEARDVFIPLLLEFGKMKEGRGKKTLQILVPYGIRISKEELESAKELSAEIRTSDHILFDMMITDLDDVLIGVPDPLSNEINHAVAIWVRNSSFARSTRVAIEEIWKSAKRI
jgi:sugar-specific transcriptional regulator TrmB